MGADEKVAATFHPSQAPAAPIDPASLPVGGCPALVRWPWGAESLRWATPSGWRSAIDQTKEPWSDKVTIVRIWPDAPIPDPLAPWEGWTRIDRPGPEHVSLRFLFVEGEPGSEAWHSGVISRVQGGVVYDAENGYSWIIAPGRRWFLAPGQQPPTNPDTDLKAEVRSLLAKSLGVYGHNNAEDVDAAAEAVVALVRERSQASADEEGYERCSTCRHAPHKGACFNMASDNDCDCTGGVTERVSS